MYAPAAAVAADESSMPIRARHLGGVALRHFGGVGLGLVAAIEAPDDQPHLGRSGVLSVIGGPLYLIAAYGFAQPSKALCGQ
jgi:hypothetical protein